MAFTSLGRAKTVYNELAKLYGRTNYVVDLLRSAEVEGKALGDYVDIPEIGQLTVGSAVDGSMDLQDVSAQAHGLTAGQLRLNLQPMINVQLPLADRVQVMDGSFASQLALQSVLQLRNDMDSTAVTGLRAAAYDSTATYFDNVGGGTLTTGMVALTKGKLIRSGAMAENLVAFCSPESESQIQGLVTNASGAPAAGGDIGLSSIGRIAGVPFYPTPAVAYRRTVTSTAWAITGTTTHTITVAAGHGIVPGQKYTFNTVTADGDLATPVTVSSVTATTIVYTTTGLSNASATEAGTITLDDSEIYVVDKLNCMTAIQKEISVREVPVAVRAGDNMQIFALWGFKFRVSNVRTLMID